MLTIELLSTEKAELERELTGYENKRRRLTLIIELMKTFGSDPRQGELGEVMKAAAGKFEGWGTTDGIVAFLNENPQEFFTAREIANALIAGGMKSDTPNFSTTVHTNCARKAASGDFEVGEKNGFKAFRVRQPTSLHFAA